VKKSGNPFYGSRKLMAALRLRQNSSARAFWHGEISVDRDCGNFSTDSR
jgi:hypothetical protein